MISIQVTGFDWDGGNQEKCTIHGLKKDKIEDFFFHGNLFVAPDPLHSKSEERFLAVGQLPNERPMFVVFTIRKINDGALIRPISARYMHKREAKKYEEENTKIKER